MGTRNRNRPPRVLYAKGGRAIAEAQRLFPQAGEPPPLGPDQFLIAALNVFGLTDFRLISVAPHTQAMQFDHGEALEYGLRPQAASSARRTLAKLAALLRFCSDTWRWRPDLTLGGIEGPLALAGMLLAKISGTRFVFLVHTDIAAPALSAPMRWLNRFVTRHADAVLVHGPFLRDRALQAGCKPDRLLAFDTGFDPSGLVAPASLDTPEQEQPTFLYAGRIEADKGVFDLLRAFECIADSASVRLTFAGTGGELPRLQEQASVSRHSSCIDVLGSTPHRDLLGRMRDAIAVVTPTQSCISEGRCMSAMESLLLGTPVIAPQLGAFPYLVQHGDNGLTYAPDSVTALSDAMRQLLQDPALLQRLQAGAKQSGQALMQPAHSFLSRLREVAQRFQTASLP